MTFTDIVTEICARITLTSSEAQTRIGRAVNIRYKQITTKLGMQTSRRASVNGVTATVSAGTNTATFAGLEKITRVWDGSSGTKRFLKVRTPDTLRDLNPVASDTATRYAVYSQASTTVTILTDATAQDGYTLYADGYATVSTLSGTDEPAFPESFHRILVEAVLIDEYKKLQKRDLAKDSKEEFEQGLSDLRMWHAKNGYLKVRQGETPAATLTGSGMDGGGGTSATSGETSYTQTGLVTFDRGVNAPFAVAVGAGNVANLDADLLDGHDSTYFTAYAANASNLTSGTVALARLSGITNTQIDAAAAIAWTKVSKTGSSLADLTTRSATDLTSGTLPDARFPATLPAASGVNLTALNGSNVASGTVALARGGTGGTTYTRGLLSCSSGATGLAAASTNYIGQGKDSTSDEAAQSFRVPFACTIKNLYVYMNGDPGNTFTFITTVRLNGADQTLTCTVTGNGASSLSAADTTHSFAAVAGDRISIKVVVLAGASTRTLTAVVELAA